MGTTGTAAAATTTATATATAAGAPTSRARSNSNHNHNHNHPPPSHPLAPALPSPAAMAATAAKSTRRPLPDTYSTLVTSVASFLAVSIHQILYLRSIYPQYTFLPVRQFNHPVRQSRHPRVCTWISDACTAVEAQLLKCTVAAVSVVILSVSTNRPLERYTFDMTQMPNVEGGDIHTPFESSVPPPGAAAGGAPPPSAAGGGPGGKPPSVDLEAQFRAVLARLASACARLTPLPPDEEYLPTLHIVLRPDADAPAGVAQDDQMWIAADPDYYVDSPRNSQQDLGGRLNDNDFGDSYRAQHKSEGNAAPGPTTSGSAAAGPAPSNGTEKERTSRARAKTVPVRTVDAGEVKLEVWVEEAKGKFEELDRIHSVHP